MRILSLDSTSMTLSCALTDGDKCLAEMSLLTEHTHSERLMPLIDDLLGAAGLDISDIDYYACSVGPGSFTGLRIGLSTIKGLAYANKKRVVPVSSLDALCENVPHSKYQVCPLIDARKGEVFAAFYMKARGKGASAAETVTKSDEFNITPHDLVKLIKRKTLFLGNGAKLYKDILTAELTDRALFVPDELNYIKALNIAKLALNKIKSRKTIKPENLLPIYIRASDAELHFKG